MILPERPGNEISWWLYGTVEMPPQRPRERPFAEAQQVVRIAEQSGVPRDAVQPPGVFVVHRAAERGWAAECLHFGRGYLVAPVLRRQEAHASEAERSRHPFREALIEW